MSLRDNTAERRYELDNDGFTSTCDYRDSGLGRLLTHVETPEAARGRGHAAKLMAAIVESARKAGMKLTPRCSYAVAYFRRHPNEVADVEA